jgi:hypothetical protein
VPSEENATAISGRGRRLPIACSLPQAAGIRELVFAIVPARAWRASWIAPGLSSWHGLAVLSVVYATDQSGECLLQAKWFRKRMIAAKSVSLRSQKRVNFELVLNPTTSMNAFGRRFIDDPGGAGVAVSDILNAID